MVTSNLNFNPFPNFVPMNFVIVDVETTGGNTKDSKITELAMYKYDGKKSLTLSYRLSIQNKLFQNSSFV